MGLLLLFPLSLGPASAGINLAVLVGDLWAPLNATGPADAVFWTESDLYENLDEAKNELARAVGVFVRYDTSIDTVTNTGAYTLPADHASTIQVDLAGAVLRPRAVQDLEALDSAWLATTGTPKAFVRNRGGMEELTLYPAPDVSAANEAIGILEHAIPATIALSNAILGAPVVMTEYFRFFALNNARQKESAGQMQDTAAWFGSLAAMMLKTATGYWGAAE